MAKKNAGKRQDGGDTLSGIAESLGSMLGNAEKQWRAWQGPRDAVVKAVSDVRDRAVALLSEMGAAAETAAGRDAKKGKKKDKKDKKGKKARKAERAAAAERARAEAAAAEKAKAEKAAKPAKPAKAEKKARKKTGRKKMARRARAAATSAPTSEPAEGPDATLEDALEAGDMQEF